jgi:uncharacterized protein involved in exopolysaccharide biosynthesis
MFGTLFICLCFIIYAYKLPNKYQSSAILSIASSQESPSSSASGLSSLASLAGISSISDGEDSSSLAIETIRSRILLKRILDSNNFINKLYAAESFDMNSGKIIYDNDIYNDSLNKWIEKEPSLLEVHKLYLQDILSIGKDKRTGFINISITHQSPIFAKNLIEIIVLECNKLVKEKDLKESSDALDYLYNFSGETSIQEVKKSINSLIESNLKTQMYANISNYYLLEYLDPPLIPEEKISPRRSMIAILGFVLGFFVSIFLIICNEIFLKRK